MKRRTLWELKLSHTCHLQVHPAAARAVCGPGAGDDRGLRTDLQGTLQRHPLRDEPQKN